MESKMKNMKANKSSIIAIIRNGDQIPKDRDDLLMGFGILCIVLIGIGSFGDKVLRKEDEEAS